MKIRALSLFLSILALSVYGQESVRIGLLTQDKDHKAALQAAELAVMNANSKGGINGRKVELKSKSMEGPWGTGSKQAVDLIWNDRVCALITACDGRNAHLVEQASAKSIMPMISAWSTDPTLSHAFIPWFFNCLPNDEQQGKAIVQEVFRKRGLKRPLIITDNNYDSQKALSGYKRHAPDDWDEASLLYHFEENNSADLFIRNFDHVSPDCIIILAAPETAREVIHVLKKRNAKLPVFGSLQLLNEDILSPSEYSELENNILFSCTKDIKTDHRDFSRQYLQKYKRNPGLVASFTYDAVNLLIRAITMAGSTENEDISKNLSSIRYNGVTGTISFAEWGVREGSCNF